MKQCIEMILDWISDNGELSALIIGIIGFYSREMYKLSIKKRELKYTTFYSHSVSSISTFVNAFHLFRASMKDIPLAGCLEGSVRPEELDRMASEPLRTLKRHDLTMRLYLDRNLYETYSLLTKESMNLHSTLALIISDKSRTPLEKCNRYDEAFRNFERHTEDCLSEAVSKTQKLLKH